MPLRTPFITVYPDDFYIEVTVGGRDWFCPVLTTTEFKLLTGQEPKKGLLREELLNIPACQKAIP